jgi:LPXTG-motif cell wall-anchored protein
VNNTDVLQTNGDDNDVEVDDSGNLAVSPEQAAKCEQKVNQAASASAAPAPAPKTAPAPAPAPKTETPQAKAAAPAPAPKAATKAEAKTEKAEAKKAAAPKQLPATGGVSLFALGAGVLLVGGGLLARRIFR